jgi:hypothetical protein
MTETRQILKVFLGSPGDLAEERRAASDLVNDFNEVFGQSLGCHVELVGWEQTPSQFARPQDAINKQLDACDIFVGMMWKRWGTPPSVDGLYSSGFEEEFRRCLDWRKSRNRPAMSMFFKEVSAEVLQDPGEDLKKVIAFKAELIERKEVYFESFTSISDLEKKLRRVIAKHIQDLKQKNEDLNEVSQSPHIAEGAEKKQTAVPSPLSEKGVTFLRNFVSVTEGVVPGKVTPSDIARFRLLSKIVGSSENDSDPIGVHDANILYKENPANAFGPTELTGLISAGLQHFGAEIVPLWRWVVARTGNFRPLAVMSRYAKEEQKIGAIQAMQVVQESLLDGERDATIREWLSPASDQRLKQVALGYLTELGKVVDCQVIRDEFSRNDSQTASYAAVALIAISLRESRKEALAAIYETQQEKLPGYLIDAIFSVPDDFSDSEVKKGLDYPSSSIRKEMVLIARKREIITIEIADKLLGDEDAAIRREALEFLSSSGRVFSDEEAKNTLIRNQDVAILGRGMDKTGDKEYENFRRVRLAGLSKDKLVGLAEAASIFDAVPIFVLAEKYFSENAEWLRKEVDERFSGRFSRYLEKMKVLFGAGSDLVVQSQGLSSFTPKRLTEEGLKILLRKGDQSDLSRIRKAKGDGLLYYSSDYMRFFKKYGEWSDIKLLIDVGPSQPLSLLSAISLPGGQLREMAEVIYSIGKARPSDLIEIEMPAELRAHLIVVFSDAAFAALSDNKLLELLDSPHDVVRKATCIRSTRSLTRKRLSGVFARYLTESVSRYYNVNHWLDMGLSIPRQRAISASNRLIEKGWKIS